MSQSVGIVCAHYDPAKVDQTLRILGRIKRHVPALHSVFVANHDSAWRALQASPAIGGSSTTVLRHDNSGMEFGASQAGLDRLLADHDPEWVLFANDTVATHHSFGTIYRRKLAAELGRRREVPAIIGQVVSLPRSFQIEGRRTHRWITTNLFALNRAALRVLDGRVYRIDLDARVTETSEMADFFALQVDPVLREHLEAWLFRAHPGWHWYASDPLSAINMTKMARKARSILQEKYLSAVLEDVGAEFVNVKELSVRDKLLSKAECKLFDLIGRDL